LALDDLITATALTRTIDVAFVSCTASLDQAGIHGMENLSSAGLGLEF
jgi:hypothetical protein